MNRSPHPTPSPSAVPALTKNGSPVPGIGFQDPAPGGMDVVRAPHHARQRRRRRWLGTTLGLAGVGLTTFLLGRLKPAAPGVERGSVWVDTVKRGPMVRQVRGLGTLVPEEIRWIAARTEGRVEKIAVFPGATVEPDTALLVLSNPELQQSALDADAAVTAAQAKLVNARAQLEGLSLERQAAYAHAQGDRDTAIAQVEVNERLSKQGLIATVELKKSQISARMLSASCDIEKQRCDFTRQSIEPQLAVAQGELDQAKAQAALRRGQLDALQVRAGMTGVLQQVPVEVGQRVSAGTNLARVADPTRLKAQVKIPETQARDIVIGQPGAIDTRTGAPPVVGRVARVDPAVQGGTVLVDVSFEPGTALPRGARPDLSVEGTVELERLDEVLSVGRPAFGQEDAVASLFKLSADGAEAVRTRVRLGRGSVNQIEVKEGLQPGDRVILSDTSAFDAHERIRLN